MLGSGLKRFEELAERELLALAIGAEEEDGHIYRDIAARLVADFPSTAKVFAGMAAEEDAHRRALIEVFRTRFGEHIPLVRRADVTGFERLQPLWLAPTLDVEKLWCMAEALEAQNRRFYMLAASRCTDARTRKLLGDLAAAEGGHADAARQLQATHLTENAKGAERVAAQRKLVLQVIQPGLAGLMDGSVSTLAPLFAAAFATQDSHATLMVGLAAAVGAGISMGLTEGMSDDGRISGRGSPWLRGTVCGAMTTLGGALHALPFLLTDVRAATILAAVVVAAELVAIAWIRWKWMDSPFWRAILQVVLGGALVVLAGVLLGGG